MFVGWQYDMMMSCSSLSSLGRKLPSLTVLPTLRGAYPNLSPSFQRTVICSTNLIKTPIWDDECGKITGIHICQYWHATESGRWFLIDFVRILILVWHRSAKVGVLTESVVNLRPKKNGTGYRIADTQSWLPSDRNILTSWEMLLLIVYIKLYW